MSDYEAVSASIQERLDDMALERAQRTADTVREVSARERLAAALRLHDPQRLCQAHHHVDHTCGGPWFYRCFTCRQTRDTPCNTWKALTGKETP